MVIYASVLGVFGFQSSGKINKEQSLALEANAPNESVR